MRASSSGTRFAQPARVTLSRLLLGVLSCLSCFCGCSSASPPPVDHGQSSDRYPAFTLDVPQVVVAPGGMVLRTPIVRAVTFMGDPLQAHIEDLVSHLGDPGYWAATTAEYGVGPLMTGPPIEVAEAPPPSVDSSQVEAWLSAKLDGTHPEFGAPDANTIYEIFYPAATVVTYDAAPGCGGYHYGTNIGGTAVSYAVVADCTKPPSDAAFADLDLAASHEVVEAATDPCLTAGCTGFQVDSDHYVWRFLQMLNSSGPWSTANSGGEVGDLCFSEADGFTVPGTLYDVQRIWSNAAMRAGHNPCVPRTATAPYFNAMPVLPDDIDFAVDAETTVRTKGVSVPVGQSRTVELDLYSDGDTGGPFKVTLLLVDIPAANAPVYGPPSLRLSLDRSSGQNGEKLYLTITRTMVRALGTVVVVESTLGTTTTSWPIAVSP
jgi:hypothetical protein